MEVCSDLAGNANKKARYGRIDVAEKVIDIKAVLKKTRNKSEAAREAGVPRSTARYWLDREGKSGASPEIESLFESPVGMAFLHQLVVSAQFAITQLAGGGVDILATFLRLSQLDKFIASSHGALHKQAMAMEQAIIQFGADERKQLASQMPQKEISICQDETFHPEICLVAIEPVSNFILLEEYSEKRDAESWSKAMKEALYDLPISIIQSTSDEGPGLVKYVEKELGAHHSSDLFHGQQEITRAISAPFRAKVKHAETVHEASKAALVTLDENREKIVARSQSATPWYDLVQQIKAEESNVKTTARLLQEVKERQESASEAKKALGTVYHPYDLTTGAPQTAEEISEKIDQQLTIIETAATSAGLSENSMKRLAKARRVFQLMISTIVFFWSTVKQQVMALGLSPELESLMHDLLIPGLYLQLAAKKAKGAAERKRIAKLAAELLARLDLCTTWCCLLPPQREQIREVALQCAQLFQRSSSCVEGRNGYLSLRHHSSHRLSKRKLGALTVIHNFFIKRPNETTAAERFFEAKHKNLFKYLLDNLSISARPAKTRRVSQMAA
jgi:hypothetical protein